MKKPLIVLIVLIVLINISFLFALSDVGVYDYYPMNASAGTNVKDWVDSSNNGTTNNMADGDWQAGKIGNALYFDGATHQVDMSAGPINSEFTLACWIEPDTIVSYDTIVRYPLVGNTFALFAGTLCYWSGGWRCTTETVAVDTWSLAGLSVNATGGYLYINGTQEGFNAATFSTGIVMNVGYYPGAGTLTFDGKIDQCIFVNKSWTAEEHLEYWNDHAGIVYPFAVPDTCTYSGSGNWAVDCADNCTISSNVVGDLSNLTIIGTGTFILNANISDFVRYYFRGACRVTCKDGCFKE